MPELPEVETIRRGLERSVVGRRVIGVDVPTVKILRPPYDSPEEFSKYLVGRRVESAERRGKYLILSLENGYSLAAHLKMRGQMRVGLVDALGDDRYVCVRMQLDDGCEWRYVDMWTWGEIRLLPVEASRVAQFVPALASIGPEPLGDEFSPETFRRAAERSNKRSVKALLLDQDVVAGVGNIYADESLHRAGIHPARRAGSVTAEEFEELYAQVRAVIGDAVELGGTASDNFVDIVGNPGKYIPLVYGRSGELCGRCGTTLQRTIITGRGTAYCSSCQPLAENRRA